MERIPLNNSDYLEVYRPKKNDKVQYRLTFGSLLYGSSIATVSICKKLDTSGGYYGIAVPFKLLALRDAIKNKEYIPATLNIVSCASLCFPQYRLASIALDIISAGFNIYHSRKTSSNKEEEEIERLIKKTLDPSKISDACKILDIEESQLENSKLVTENYDKIISGLQKRKAHTEKISPRLALEVQQLIEESERAYNTLIKTMKKN